jgi:hypothetical protein
MPSLYLPLLLVLIFFTKNLILALPCSFTTHSGTFDFSTLGTVHAVSRETASRGWAYLFDVCANIEASSTAGLCGGTVGPAPAVQATAGACHSLGQLYRRQVSAFDDTLNHRVGATVSFDGGDACGPIQRSISIDVLCSDSVRPANITIVESTERVCLY